MITEGNILKFASATKTDKVWKEIEKYVCFPSDISHILFNKDLTKFFTERVLRAFYCTILCGITWKTGKIFVLCYWNLIIWMYSFSCFVKRTWKVNKMLVFWNKKNSPKALVATDNIFIRYKWNLTVRQIKWNKIRRF